MIEGLEGRGRGLGYRAQGLEIGQGLGFRAQGLETGQGLGFRV
jgi:hypothetical protein